MDIMIFIDTLKSLLCFLMLQEFGNKKKTDNEITCSHEKL